MDEQNLDTTRIHDKDTTQIHRTPSIRRTPSDQEAPAPGLSSVGDYTLHRSLGEGGFAEVFLAEDRRTGRQVALKLLRPEVSNNAEIVRRFRSVAERVQALEHPNIVPVYGYEIVGERPAIVMEYVNGASLREVLAERGPLPVNEALDIALQLCDALIHAHDSGFIHRDVKPENLLITAEGAVKLSDFDIAKIATSSAVTRVGQRLGTAYFMSPEQLRGQPDLDARSDVFSVGAVLYEMVTGEVPAGHFGHPSEQNPDLPRRLGSVILKALARDRGARYASIQELREALTGSPEAKQEQSHAFHFRNRREPAQTIAELIEMCEVDWESARWHLTRDHFFRWLQVVNPDLAHEVEVALGDEADPDLTLERLLHLLDPTLPHPVLAVSPESEIDLGDMAAGEVRDHALEVSNPSRGYLVGSAASDVPWLQVSPAEFRLKEGEGLVLTLAAEAPATLEEHRGQIILESNGGTVSVPVCLRTAVRLLFPQAGRSAGSVAELVELCNAHRAEATKLFYNGAIESWLEEGPLLFRLVARAEELRGRYSGSKAKKEREKGLRDFLLACGPEKRQEPFRFRTGEQVETYTALVKLCEERWADAQWHLYQGHFATWLEIVDPVLVAEAERIRETEKDQNLGLELFLHLLNPELRSPQLEVEPQELDLGTAAPGEKKEVSVTIRNAGRGYLSGKLAVPDASWVRLEPRQNSFGCLVGKTHKFRFVAKIPAKLGEHSIAVPIESNGGEFDLPVRVQVALNLLFPEANLSVGSVEELAKVSSRCWEEARTLWENGQVREWLHRGLRHFDLVHLADRIGGASDLSPDIQLIQFLLQACPKCQRWLPPCLQIGQDTVDLGTALHRALPYRLRVNNIGGGDLEGLRVIQCPTWLDTRTLIEEPSGVTLELIGDTRHLEKSGLFEESLVLEWAGPFGGAILTAQRVAVSVRMRVADSLRIGRWRIPFGGRAQIGNKTISVRVLWVAGIGLVSLLLGVAAGSLLKKDLWAVVIWLVLWLAGGIAWTIYGLGYQDIPSLARDVLDWLGSGSQNERG